MVLLIDSPMSGFAFLFLVGYILIISVVRACVSTRGTWNRLRWLKIPGEVMLGSYIVNGSERRRIVLTDIHTPVRTSM